MLYWVIAAKVQHKNYNAIKFIEFHKKKKNLIILKKLKNLFSFAPINTLLKLIKFAAICL